MEKVKKELVNIYSGYTKSEAEVLFEEVLMPLYYFQSQSMVKKPKYKIVDRETGKEVDYNKIVKKGYEVGKDKSGVNLSDLLNEFLFKISKFDEFSDYYIDATISKRDYKEIRHNNLNDIRIKLGENPINIIRRKGLSSISENYGITYFIDVKVCEIDK